ncbi:protein THEMIS2 [Elgaria multicarinata webbii]|uniref:protein THEMIS2 n=1 Tax=Elgaria multicarinata webbii TaxID=159646 RepID=UPI002FCD4672
MDSVSFHRYICDLDLSSLPRVVKICSGVYFQGSVYEVWGSECCLSTGDLMKIVDVQLQNVTCKNVQNEHSFELPLDFKGLFQPSSATPCGNQRKPIPFRKDNCQQQKLYTLREVLQSAAMRQKRLKCAEIGWSEFQLYPVYKVEAIMHFRNDVVKINSTLDVEVVDVTAEAQHIHFIKPLMLSEVLAMEMLLPAEAELLEGPESLSVFQSDWASHLHKGQRIHIHSKTSSCKILASARKGKARTCHFLISSGYKGRFRRSPRKFSSTSELALSLVPGKKLQVVVTKDYDSSDGEFPLFSEGDRLEVLRFVRAGNLSSTDMLVCCRDNGDEDREQIQVPLFLDAGFMEDVRDSRRYTLAEAVEHLRLPCEVKVIASDCGSDPLRGCSVLTLETQINEPFLTVSLAKEPHLAFEIPPQWLDMSLFFTRDPVKSTPPTCTCSVEELTEAFYYLLLKQLPSSGPAPPRPPKRKDSKPKKDAQKAIEGEKDAAKTSKVPSSKSNIVSQEPAGLEKITTEYGTLNKPNQYNIEYGPPRFQRPTKPWKQPESTTFSDDSDHDYEEIDEKVKEVVHKIQRAAIKH